MLCKGQRAVVLAPHQDDEVLGCGATLYHLAQVGVHIHVASLGVKVIDHCVDPQVVERYRANACRAAEILRVEDVRFFDFETEVFERSWRELMAALDDYVREIEPDWVFMPWDGDLHQDHRATSTAARLALRLFGAHAPKKVLMYATPGSTGFASSAPFQPNVWVRVDDFAVEAKIAAYRCYEEELRHGAHPRDVEVLLAEMRVNGAAVGAVYAEKFQLYHEVLR